MSEPKRWRCVECGHIDHKTRVSKSGVYGCIVCNGHLKESEMWLKWHEDNRQRQIKNIKENGGYFLGRKVF